MDRQVGLDVKDKKNLRQKLHNTLSKRENLLTRGVEIILVCLLYKEDIKSNNHLFWESPSIQRLWSLACQHTWIHLLDITVGPQCAGQLILDFKQSPNSEDVKKVASLLWQI